MVFRNRAGSVSSCKARQTAWGEVRTDGHAAVDVLDAETTPSSSISFGFFGQCVADAPADAVRVDAVPLQR